MGALVLLTVGVLAHGHVRGCLGLHGLLGGRIQQGERVWLGLVHLGKEALQVGAQVRVANFSLHIPVPLVDLALLEVETLSQLRDKFLAPIGRLVELVLQDLVLVLVLAATLGLPVGAQLREIRRQEFRGPLRFKIFCQTQEGSESGIHGGRTLTYAGERTHFTVD